MAASNVNAAWMYSQISDVTRITVGRFCGRTLDMPDLCAPPVVD